MLLVIEGPDGAGKTTLAGLVERVCRQEGMSVMRLHAQQPEPGQDGSEYLTDLEFYEPSLLHNEAVIVDRWHLGELIYGPMYRGASRLTMTQAQEIDRRLDQLGAIRLHLDAPDMFLVERAFEKRGEDFVKNQADLLKIARVYRELAMQLGWRTRSSMDEAVINRHARDMFRMAVDAEDRAVLAARGE